MKNVVLWESLSNNSVSGALVVFCSIMQKKGAVMQDKDIDEFLMLAGFKKRHRGFGYIKYGMNKFCESNYDSRVLGVSLYKELASLHGKAAKTIEKNITCAIESAYLRGDMDYLCDMGLVFDNMRGRPTNCEFIATSAVNLSLKGDVEKY